MDSDEIRRLYGAIIQQRAARLGWKPEFGLADEWLFAEIERLRRQITDTEQVRDQRWQMVKDARAEIERLQKLLSGARHSRRNWVIEYGWNAKLNDGGFFIRRRSSITSQWAGRTLEEAWAKVADETRERTG